MSLPKVFKMDVLAENGVPFRVCFIWGEKALVEFYDLRYDFTPNGQFTGARYYLDTLMEGNPFSGLMLHGGVDSWRIDGDTMQLIRKWLNSFEIV